MTTAIPTSTPVQHAGHPALAGTLADWSLVDVIQLLGLGKKTGALVIHGHRGNDPIEGQIAFIEGTIYYARNGEHVGIDAVLDLFGVLEGTFRFSSLDVVPPRNIFLSNEHLIMEGIARQEQPSPVASADDGGTFVHLVPVPHRTHAVVVMTPEQWRIVALIQGETSLDVLAEQLNLSPPQVCEVLHDLVEAGLVAERQSSGRS